jgi:hypothetical protein
MYYFATVILLLLSGNATFLPFYNINWFIVEFLFIWIGIECNRFSKRDIRLFLNFAVIYVSYCAFRSAFLNNNLPVSYFISDIVYLFKFILPSFLFCALLKDKAIYYLSRVIIDMAVISIGFFFLQLFAGDLLFSIGKTIGIPPIATSAGYEYTNFIVFNFVKTHLHQNSGFAWEPGAYGFFLNVGLALHFLSNGFKLDGKARWIILAILTTISTTSYIAMALVFVLFFRSRGMKFNKLIILATPVLLVAVFQLPFLADKIIATYNYDMHNIRDIDFLTNYYIKIGEQMPLNRFATIIYIYNLFGAKLIFGVSNIFTDTVPAFKNINTANGIVEFCAKFGLIGLVFLLYRSYLFFRKYTYGTEAAIYCLILLLILGFGESIFILPLMSAFYFLYYYAEPEDDAYEEFNEDDADMHTEIAA